MNYESYHALRTAGSTEPIKSVQAWKKAKPTNIVENNIANALAEVGTKETRTAGPRFSLNEETTTTNKDAYSFKDVIDVINPLHHVPIVGTVYRKLTGDTLHPASRVIGGSIYGGPIGAITSTLGSISEMRSGQDINDYALSLVTRTPSHNIYEHKMATHAYQPDPDQRTVGFSVNTSSPPHNDISYSKPEIYTVAPVTQISLSPMPAIKAES